MSVSHSVLVQRGQDRAFLFWINWQSWSPVQIFILFVSKNCSVAIVADWRIVSTLASIFSSPILWHSNYRWLVWRLASDTSSVCWKSIAVLVLICGDSPEIKSLIKWIVHLNQSPPCLVVLGSPGNGPGYQRLQLLYHPAVLSLIGLVCFVYEFDWPGLHPRLRDGFILPTRLRCILYAQYADEICRGFNARSH